MVFAAWDGKGIISPGKKMEKKSLKPPAFHLDERSSYDALMFGKVLPGIFSYFPLEKTRLNYDIVYTPWKINMEPSNHHPLRKEHDLPNLHDYVPC